MILTRHHCKNEKCTGGMHSKVHVTGMAAGNVNGERDYQCLWLANQRLQDVLKVWKMFHVAIGPNQKVEYHLNCLENGLKKFMETLLPKRGR